MIKNFSELETSELRKQALLIAESGYEAIDTEKVVTSKISYNSKTTELQVEGQSFILNKYKKITCIGFGKAAFHAVKALQEKIGSAITCGFVLDLKAGALENITCRVGTHPYPTEVNVAATKELLAMVENTEEDDLVIFIVSGGGSSLLCYPNDINCDTESSIIDTLSKEGATIQELNTVRKHISKIKGGYLAKVCYPGTVLSLIFSDVPGNDLSVIASGPTVLDHTTVADAERILNKYKVLELCKLQSCSLIETPKEEKYFEKVHNILLVSPIQAIHAMQEKAKDLGWETEIYSSSYQGMVDVLAKDIFSKAKSKICLLGAGEANVNVKGKGLEGRCQAIALHAIDVVKEQQVFLPLASDGEDHSDAAGVILDSEVSKRAKALNLIPQDFLDNNDSYHFFEKTGNLIFTGKTGSNVSDFFILLTE